MKERANDNEDVGLEVFNSDEAATDLNENSHPVFWSLIYLAVLCVITARNTTSFFSYSTLQEDLSLLIMKAPET